MDQQEEDAAFQELQRRVETARAALEQDPHHNLNFGQVMSILSMFGTRVHETGAPYPAAACEDERQAALLGMQRRQWNALLCAEKIVPLWSLSAVEPYLPSEDVDKLRVLDLRKHLEEAKNAVLVGEEYSPPEFEPTEDSLIYSLKEQSKKSTAINQAANAYAIVQ